MIILIALFIYTLGVIPGNILLVAVADESCRFRDIPAPTVFPANVRETARSLLLRGKMRRVVV